MASLDTNVLVRLLVKDDERQAAQARKLVQAESDRGETLFVPITLMFISLQSTIHRPRARLLMADANAPKRSSKYGSVNTANWTPWSGKSYTLYSNTVAPL